MDNRKKIMMRLRRASGMSIPAQERLKEELHKLEWWAKCWKCRRTVEGTMEELQGKCKHCGAELKYRKGKPLEEPDRSPLKYDDRRKLIRPKGVKEDEDR